MYNKKCITDYVQAPFNKRKTVKNLEFPPNSYQIIHEKAQKII